MTAAPRDPAALPRLGWTLAALVLLWRSFCELYVALFRLSDDLHAIRQATDAEYSVKSQQPKR